MREPALLKVGEACRYLGVGRSLLYELIDAGKLRRVKIGRTTRIRKFDLDRLIDRNTERRRKGT